MKLTRMLSVALAAMSCMGLIIPQAVLAAPPAAKRNVSNVLDIAVRPGGLLIGKVVNRQGKPKRDVVVALLQNQGEVVRAKTDDEGRFAVQGLKAGSYSLATSSGQISVRLWEAASAPPKAALGALLVDGGVVRGQTPVAPEVIPANPVPENAGEAANYVEGPVEHYGQGSPSYHGHGHARGHGGGLFGYGLFGGHDGYGVSPFVVAGVIVTALAIPIILDDDDAS